MVATCSSVPATRVRPGAIAPTTYGARPVSSSASTGGASGENDLHDAVRTAVINKRAGGMGLISGRKAFQKPMRDGIALLNAIQDVYLSKDVTVA